MATVLTGTIFCKLMAINWLCFTAFVRPWPARLFCWPFLCIGCGILETLTIEWIHSWRANKRKEAGPFELASFVRYRYKLSNFLGGISLRGGVLPLARWVGRIKTEGKEQSALRQRAKTQLFLVPLIPTIVAPYPFKFAIASAHIRFHFDNPHNLHPYGDVNRSGSCSSFHES